MNYKFYFSRKWKSVSSFFLFLCLLMGSSAIAQDALTITGVVLEYQVQTPLPGVNIIEKGTSNGTSTDFDGNYSITVSNPNAVLIVSYIGFEAQEINVAGKSNINVTLTPAAESLNEVVVIGYGQQRRRDVTGAIGSIDSKAITERNFTNPLESLQGNVAGVQISSPSGRVGESFNISIRGLNTFGSNTSPLFVVDGVPLTNIDFLNPQDIERMDILKDASSTAIYGSRAANGVVIITTKSGKSAKSGISVSFDTFAGIKEVARLPEFMNAEEWWTYHRSANLATIRNNLPDGSTFQDVTDANFNSAVNPDGRNDLLFERANNGFDFDWLDAALKSAFQQNSYVNVTGRSENGMAYNLGLGVQSETGNIPKESLDRYTVKLGLDQRVNDKLSLGLNVTLANTNISQGSTRAMENVFRMSPMFSPYIDGELFRQPGKVPNPDGSGRNILDRTSTINPLMTIANSDDKTRRWTTIGSVYAQYRPVDWLTFKSTFSGNLQNSRRGRFAAGSITQERSGTDSDIVERWTTENYSYTWDNQFDINYTLNDDHNFKLLGLQSTYLTQTERSFTRVEGGDFSSSFYNLANGVPTTLLDPNSSNFPFEKSTLSSYALRFNYSYKNRYLLTIGTRWDGSSLLSKDQRWDTFPSGAIAWNIAEENFMQDQEVVSALKLRASFGYTGNNAVNAYSTLNILSSQSYYDFNGQFATGWLGSSLGNSALGWEKTREFNFGLDFGFINNRISGSVDVYDKLSEDLLLSQNLPIESGLSSTTSNIGSVSNKGVEVLLRATVVDSDLITWSNTFTFTKNTNKIESIYNDTDDVIGNGLFIGESINAYYNYKFDGVWQEDEAAEAASYGLEEGMAKVVDVNNDGAITPDDDRIILGSSDPDWSGSWFTTLRVGNFDLSASIITNQGVLAYSPFHEDATNTRQRGRQKLRSVTNMYVPRNGMGIPYNPSNEFPLGRGEGPYYLARNGIRINNRNYGVGFYRDASFVKVKNITLGYTLDSSILDQLKIKNCRIYANVLNPFVFTDYDGLDPEWATARFQAGRVASITYQLGLSLKF